MNYQTVAALSDEQNEAICVLLRAYNRAANPAFFSACDAPENLPKPLSIVVYDGAGVVVGGLIAETQFQWLKVSIVVVAESARRRGIGNRLVEIAEDEAKVRGCTRSYLDTMDYQAPDFYRKRGYQIAGKLENWDSHGHTKLFFTKSLV